MYAAAAGGRVLIRTNCGNERVRYPQAQSNVLR